jgi:integrase
VGVIEMGSIQPTKYTVLPNGKKKADRDSKWEARWRTPDGKSREKIFDKRVDADQHLTSIENSKLTGAYVDPRAGKITFKTFAEKWRALQVHNDATMVSLEQHLRLHVYPVIGDRPIGAIRPSEIQGLVRKMESSLAASTLAVAYGRVVAVFRAALRDRVIASSPCVDIRLPRSSGTSAVHEVLEPAQVLSLAEAVPARYRGLILTGAGLGLRPGELFGLAADRVEFLKRTARIDQQVVRVRGAGVQLTPKLKTKAAYRSIPVSDAVSQAIAAHMSEFPPHLDLGLIFTNEHGEPIQQHPFAMVFKHGRDKAGLPDWATPHDLRHFYASTLIRAGLSSKVIQARLGHESAKTTLDVYGHLFPDEEDRTRTAIDAVLGAPCGESVGWSGSYGTKLQVRA